MSESFRIQQLIERKTKVTPQLENLLTSRLYDCVHFLRSKIPKQLSQWFLQWSKCTHQFIPDAPECILLMFEMAAMMNPLLPSDGEMKGCVWWSGDPRNHSLFLSQVSISTDSLPRAQGINGTVVCVMGSLVLQECLVPEEFQKLTGVKWTFQCTLTWCYHI